MLCNADSAAMLVQINLPTMVQYVDCRMCSMDIAILLSLVPHAADTYVGPTEFYSGNKIILYADWEISFYS